MATRESSNERVEGVVAVFQRDGRYLVIRRAERVRSGGSWCFPGGTIEEGESQREALVREMREELGVFCEPIERCWEWEREDGKLRLYLWRARLSGGAITPNAAEVSEFRWATRAEILCLPKLLASMRQFFREVDPVYLEVDSS